MTERSHEQEGWALYAAEQERHAETQARLDLLRDRLGLRCDGAFCAACPDHEACATGYPCKVVQAVSAETRQLSYEQEHRP